MQTNKINHIIFLFANKQLLWQILNNYPKEQKNISPHQNVKQGKEGEVKGKGIAKGKPLGEGETPCFALGFVVSPSHIGFPFAGEPQKKQRSQSNVENRKKNGKNPTSNSHHQNILAQIVHMLI